MEEKLPAGLGERQVTELVEDDEVLAGEIVGDPALPPGARLGLEPIDEIDGGEEAAARARPDAASRWRSPSGSCRLRLRQRHGAGILASEETIYYAFHPLAGRTVASNGRRVVFGGDVHLTIRLPTAR